MPADDSAPEFPGASGDVAREPQFEEVHSMEEARAWFEANPDKANPDKAVRCLFGQGGTRRICQSGPEALSFYNFLTGPPPLTRQIEMFLHCGLCLKEKPADVSPSDWARVEVGWTPHGIQIWCRRHEANVLHINFEGIMHPAMCGIAQADLGLNES